MTQSRLPFSMPPLDIIRQLGNMLEPGVPRTVLDAGFGTGRNALYLAKLGHIVTGITNDPTEIETAQDLAAEAGIADRCNFMYGELPMLPGSGSFDVVLSNEVTHLFTKPVARSVFEALRRRTKQGGLNVISGYLIEPGKANVINTARCFSPGELHHEYEQAGWQELSYREEWLPVQRIGAGAVRREIISSRAKLIAQRPWN